MAKLNKIMPPRRVDIRGQDHLLAYITPDEAALLKARGGSGEPGPMGIPQYGYGDNDGSEGYGDGDSDSGTGTDGAGSGGGDDGDGYGFGTHDDPSSPGQAPSGPSSGGYDTIGRAAEKDYGVPDPTSSQIEAARGFDFGSPASKAMEASFALGFNQMGPNRGMGYNVSGREANVALGQIADRMAMAKAGYNLPGPLGILGQIAGLQAQANLSRIAENIKAGYPAAFDKQGRVQGAWGPGLVSGTMAYSGNPVEGNPGTGWSDVTAGGDGYDERPPVKPVNPETGQCDEGYMFDEDMQACRLDTRSSMGGQPSLPQVPFQPGGYARMGLLDVAPTNLPQFQQRYGAGFGSPSDFAAANTAFRQQAAYRPEYFKRPYPTDGYTLLS